MYLVTCHDLFGGCEIQSSRFVNDIWTETKKGEKQEQLVLKLFTFSLNRFSSFSWSIAMLLLSLGGEAVLR